MRAGTVFPLLPLVILEPSSGFLLLQGCIVGYRPTAGSISAHGCSHACLPPCLYCGQGDSQADSQGDTAQRAGDHRHAHRSTVIYASPRSSPVAMVEPLRGRRAEVVDGAALRRLLLRTPPPLPRQSRSTDGSANTNPCYDRRSTLSIGIAALCGTTVASSSPKRVTAAVSAPPRTSLLDQRSWQPLSSYAEAFLASDTFYPENFVMYLARILVVFDPMTRGWYVAQEAAAPRTWPEYRLREARLERMGCLGSSLAYGLIPFAAQGHAGSVALWQDLLRSVGAGSSMAAGSVSLCTVKFVEVTGETISAVETAAAFEQQLAVLFRH